MIHFPQRRRHSDIDVYYLTLSYVDLPKTTIRNNSNIISLFQQTLKDVEHTNRDIASFDMSYDEFKSLCREAWNEKYNYLLKNRLEDKNGKKNIGFAMIPMRSTKSLIHKLIFSSES